MTSPALYAQITEARRFMRERLGSDYQFAISAAQQSIRVGVTQCGWTETEAAFNAISLVRAIEPNNATAPLLFMAALIEIFEPSKPVDAADKR